MESMGTAREAKEMIITQASLGGFNREVSAKDLSDFLEKEIGMVWRCRLKTSCTPHESYPNFDVLNTSQIKRDDKCDKVEPHAFVHFASPKAAERARNAAGRCELVLNCHPLKVNLGLESSYRVNRRRMMDPFKFSDVGVEIGTLVNRDEFWVGWKGPDSGIDFLIDSFDDSCKIVFTKDVAFSIKSTNKQAVIKCDFKVEFLVREISEFREYKDKGTSQLVMFLHLRSSPLVYYRTADDDIHVSVPYALLDDEDPWIRTTDFTPSGAIGRFSSYRISFSYRFQVKLTKVMDYLRQRRITQFQPERQLRVQNEPDSCAFMSDAFFCAHCKEGISFDIMYLVNALVHKGIINQHQLSEAFYELLRREKPLVSVTALKHICSDKHPVFDAFGRLKSVQNWLLKNPKLLSRRMISDDNIEIRKLIITPTKAHCLPPEVELSNRVVRNYRNFADRFLRVTFMDEGMQQLKYNVLSYYAAPIVKDITLKSFSQRTAVFKRFRSILFDGFRLCGREYSFLAFSSNQLRDQSAWFFAGDETVSVKSITNWMGKFYNKNVAKCAARMGQCFSSTYATVSVPSQEVNWEIRDIKRNGYVFSDGIGKISTGLAMEVGHKLQLTRNPPCAYQIRYAGCKGVVACWPEDDDGSRLSLRPSMDKFQSNHTIFEVVSWTRFQPGFLNRQIVTLLSALEVPDDVFSRLQDSMVCNLNQILENADVAFEVLTSSCAAQGNNAAMMLSAGFNPRTEPHLRGMLSCIRSAQLDDLVEKARIFVPKSRWLMGCLDELGLLESGQCFIQASTLSLQNCFSKHGSKFTWTNNSSIITGIVAIAKNPCLHPGDIRILEAVDVPALHHLVDCLVFPQKGDRPHTNEASGSDLDGDLYFVTWDENLIPPSKKSYPPLDYKAKEAKELTRKVSTEDIKDFFAKNMVNANLGVICNAHVVHADLSDIGALDEKCIQLATLAATAVDFPKTGFFVTMPQELKPKMYPDFMGKDESQSYKSYKILGRLCRKIKDIWNVDTLDEATYTPDDIPYDTDLEIFGSADFVLDAWNNKCSYDGQLNALLGQYNVNSEEEVVTGHIWSMPKYNSRKQGDLKERLKHAYTALHKEYRCAFEAIGPDIQQLTEEEKNNVYEQKASAWYQVTYHPRWVKRSRDLNESDGYGVRVQLSFAWITADYLVRIKVRC
ncbi:RNA-dependent RNA polymerase 6 [Tasmannia lanceolata]|uniref:RNA-dependent RNA polymerase 6 n=1 Tax=Tasmannia lanceolata TaxID=3420 RepID=UPI004064B5CC